MMALENNDLQEMEAIGSLTGAGVNRITPDEERRRDVNSSVGSHQNRKKFWQIKAMSDEPLTKSWENHPKVPPSHARPMDFFCTSNLLVYFAYDIYYRKGT